MRDYENILQERVKVLDMFEHLQLIPPDPLLGIIDKFNKDTNPNKIDLGVGVYKDENNQTAVLDCVKQAETFLLKKQTSKSYLGPNGDKNFTRLMCQLALGEQSAGILESGRISALQTPGGCGALRVAAELVNRSKPGVKVWVSDPTWANHVPLLGDAGLTIEKYPYYDHGTKTIDFSAMLEGLKAAQSGDLVLLHACCHNPSGADLSQQQWHDLCDLMLERELVPFIDMAYQGFGEDLDKDAFGLRLVIEKCPEAIFCISCSKNFGLYRDRVGVVGFMNVSKDTSPALMSHLVQVVRGIYSMPPDHGAAVVANILDSEELRAGWLVELNTMRERIQHMRRGLADNMAAKGFGEDFRFVESERGMFSFLGINPSQVQQLGDEYGIYMADSSRINIAGLNANNLEYFCRSLATVLNAS